MTDNPQAPIKNCGKCNRETKLEEWVRVIVGKKLDVSNVIQWTCPDCGNCMSQCRLGKSWMELGL